MKMITGTKMYKLLEARNCEGLITNVIAIAEYAQSMLPKINRVFANYTGHGIEHSISVLEYMYELCDMPEKLSNLDIFASISSALLHDVGMVVSEEEITTIKSIGRDNQGRQFSVILAEIGDENLALQEYIRPNHGKRSKQHILTMNENLFLVPGYSKNSIQEDVACICAAHNEDFDWLKTEIIGKRRKENSIFNAQFVAIILRIADYLDIDERRAPFYVFEFYNPKGYGEIEWNQHYIIENTEKIIVDPQTNQKQIEFYGESSDPYVHRKILAYFDLLNEELKRATGYSESFHDKTYTLTLNNTVKNKIRTKGFSFSDYKLSLNYKAVTNLLMGENIYGQKRLGLREIIQNSIDACKVLQEEANSLPQFTYSAYQPKIDIIVDKNQGTVTVRDNGRGMSSEILRKYFLNIGNSYYNAKEYRYKGLDYSPIGNYGIGFLACFMLSDVVHVETSFFGSSDTNIIELEKDSEYVCVTIENKAHQYGTEITFNYSQFINAFDNRIVEIESFIKKYFLDVDIPIALIDVEANKKETCVVKQERFDNILPAAIRLDDYLNGIQVALKLSRKDVVLWEKLSDIYADDCFVYNDNDLIAQEDDMNPIYIKSYQREGKLSFLRVPIISNEDASYFNDAFEILEDFDAALTKTQSNDNVSIIASNILLYNENELIQSNYDYIVGNFSLLDFRRRVGHASDAPTYTYFEEHNIILGKTRRVLPYEEKINIYEYYSFLNADRIFIKSILIPNAHITIPFLIKGIQIKDMVVNIEKKRVTPDVSRNSINETQLAQLSYAIGKALHLWILDSFSLNTETRLLMKSFIDKCYHSDNPCMKVSNKK